MANVYHYPRTACWGRLRGMNAAANVPVFTVQPHMVSPFTRDDPTAVYSVTGIGAGAVGAEKAALRPRLDALDDQLSNHVHEGGMRADRPRPRQLQPQRVGHMMTVDAAVRR